MIRIRSAEPLSGFTVRLQLTNGTVVERDLKGLLQGVLFAPLRKSASVFRSFQVRGGTLTWANGADLCPDMLIWGGLPPATKKATPPKSLTFGPQTRVRGPSPKRRAS